MNGEELHEALRDPQRLAALRELDLLDSVPEEPFDRLTRLAVRVLDVPIALVSLVEDDRQFFKSAMGLVEPVATERETPLSYSFCRHAVVLRAPLIIPDARGDPLVADNPTIPEFGVVAYAGIPLITAGGHALGTFCVMDTRPRDWTEAEVDILTDLTAAALTEIELRLALRAAAAATEALHDGEERFRVAFAHATHDLKSPLTAIKGLAQLIVRQLPKVIAEPSAQVMHHARQIDALASRLAVHLDELQVSSLSRTIDVPARPQSRIDLNTLTRQVVNEQQSVTERHTMVLRETDPDVVGWWDRSLVERALRNLIVNAVKYSPDGGEIEVTVGRTGPATCPAATITVADHGIGIPAADLSRIGEGYFRGSNVPAEVEGTGLGLSGVRRLAAGCGGGLKIDSTEGVGTTVSLILGLQTPS